MKVLIDLTAQIERDPLAQDGHYVGPECAYAVSRHVDEQQEAHQQGQPARAFPPCTGRHRPSQVAVGLGSDLPAREGYGPVGLRPARRRGEHIVDERAHQERRSESDECGRQQGEQADRCQPPVGQGVTQEPCEELPGVQAGRTDPQAAGNHPSALRAPLSLVIAGGDVVLHECRAVTLWPGPADQALQMTDSLREFVAEGFGEEGHGGAHRRRPDLEDAAGEQVLGFDFQDLQQWYLDDLGGPGAVRAVGHQDPIRGQQPGGSECAVGLDVRRHGEADLLGRADQAFQVDADVLRKFF